MVLLLLLWIFGHDEDDDGDGDGDGDDEGGGTKERFICRPPWKERKSLRENTELTSCLSERLA